MLRDQRLRLLVAASLVGVCGGLAAAAFRWLIRVSWRLLAEAGSHGLPSILTIVVAPAVGGVLALWIVKRFAVEPEGHGVAAIRASLITSGGFVSARTAFAKAVACAVTTTSGGSAGCEGPVARLAAGVGSWLVGKLGVDRARLHTVTACGAAASIAGLFDAPVAGVVFAVEIILGGYAIRSFAPLIMAAATAAAVSRALWGRTHALVVPMVHSGSPTDLMAHAAIGCACGVLGALFTSLLDAAPAVAQRLRVPASTRAAVAGLAVGATIVFVPGTFGVGYPVLSDIFAPRVALGMLAALLVARLVGTTLTLGTGGAGGVVSPSLVMGASTGALLGASARAAGIGITSTPSEFAVVGSVAMMAATSHAPFTAIVLVYELTDHYAVLPPAAIACVLAALVASMIRRQPVQDADLSRGRNRRVSHRVSTVALRDRTIAPLVRSIRQTVPDTTFAAEVVIRRKYLKQSVLVVVDSHDGAVVGVLDLDKLEAIDTQNLEGPKVGDVMLRCPSVMHEHTLAEAVAVLVKHKVPALPVVDETRRPSGLLWRHDLLDACARELASEFALPAIGSVDTPLVHSDVVAALPVPPGLVGRTMRQVDLRKLHGVACLGIRRALDDGTFAPVPVLPSTRLTDDDLLIVSGRPDRIERMREPSA